MSWELVYTSVPRGLRPNTSGFCTVAVTAGMSRAVMQTIERISAYEFHFGLSDPRANENPINYLHMLLGVGGKPMHLLSRIAYAGADYSGRTNKIAHHILLSPEELSPAGPADMIRQLADAGRFYTTWAGEPRELPPSSLAAGLGAFPTHAGPPATWRSLTGDAGWAGMLVKGFRENARVPSYLLFEPGLDILQLYQESLALLPPELRWEVGFSTYYYANLLPADSKVHWRAVVSGSPLARTEVTKYPNAVVLDLTHPLGSPPANLFVTAAREGRPIESARPAPAQPQGRPGGASIDISQALNRRQPAPVSKDLLIPLEYEASSPQQLPQQPSRALQQAFAANGYQDYSLKSLDIPRRTSRWTRVFAAAAFLLLLTNTVTLLLWLVPGGTGLKETPAAQLASAKVETKAAKPAPSDPEKGKSPQDHNSTTQDANTKLAQAEQSVAGAQATPTNGKSPQSAPATEPAGTATKQSGSNGVVIPKAASQPGTQPASAPAPKATTPNSPAKRIPFDYKTSWNGALPPGDSDLSPSLAPGRISSVQVKDANTIFDPLGKIAGYVLVKVNGGQKPNAVFYARNTLDDLDLTKQLATCWLEDTDGVRWLRVEVPNDLKDKDAVLRDSLVILLGGNRNVGYRVPLRATLREQVTLSISSSGEAEVKCSSGNRATSFTHQTPDDLVVAIGGKEYGVSNKSPSICPSATGLDITVSIEGKSIVVTPVAVLAPTVAANVSSWAKSIISLAEDIKNTSSIRECILKPSDCLDSAQALIATITTEMADKDAAIRSIKLPKNPSDEDRKNAREKGLRLAKEKGALLEGQAKAKAQENLLRQIMKERDRVVSVLSETVVFRDSSGHVVQEMSFTVCWGDNGKKNK